MLAFNSEVRKVYFRILREAKALIAANERDELRYTLIKEDKALQGQGIIHELISPLLYLRLECDGTGEYAVHYGYEPRPITSEFCTMNAPFVRFIYKLTAAENTSVNIEESVRIDFVINHCSELYEHVAEHNRHHFFQLIPYKAKAVKRKLRKVA